MSIYNSYKPRDSVSPSRKKKKPKYTRCCICNCESEKMFCANCYGQDLIGPDYKYKPSSQVIDKTSTY